MERFTISLTKSEVDTIIMALEDSERYHQDTRKRWSNNWYVRHQAERAIDGIRAVEKVLVAAVRPGPPYFLDGDLPL